MHRNYRAVAITLLAIAALAISSQGQSYRPTSLFRFVNMVQSARITAMGGTWISHRDADIGQALANPAQLQLPQSALLSFQPAFLPASTQGGSIGFAFPLRPYLHAHLSAQYINYATMANTDVYGNKIGDIQPSEQAWILGVAYQPSTKWSAGVNIKWIHSSLQPYSATALLVDIGATYQLDDRHTTLGITWRNAGILLKKYRTADEPLPTELLIGLTRRLKYLPLRLHLTYRRLTRFQSTYNTPIREPSPLFGPAPTNTTPSLLRQLARHFILGGELALGKSEQFRIRMGYNHRLRDDLAPPFFSLTGMSFGLSLAHKSYRIDYAYARYHVRGNIHQLGLSYQLPPLKSIAPNLGKFVPPAPSTPQSTKHQ